MNATSKLRLVLMTYDAQGPIYEKLPPFDLATSDGHTWWLRPPILNAMAKNKLAQIRVEIFDEKGTT